MEPLDDPRKIAYNLQIPPNSDLESFLQISDPSPPHSHRQQAPQPVKTTDQRLKAAFEIFTQQGDTASFQKHIEDIIEASMAFVPHQRALAKALEAVLDEFLESEEKGGLAKEDIKQVVVHLHRALNEIVDVQADRKVLQELVGLLRELPAASVAPIELGEKNTGTRRDVESDNEEEEEEEETDGENEETNETVRMIVQYKNTHFLEEKRMGFLEGLRKEKEGNDRAMKRVLDKILDKRGYKWTFTAAGMLKEAKRSTLLAGHVVQRILDDPITKHPITDPVRSRKCTGPHIYDRASIQQLIATCGGHAPKCAYLGCGNVILERDLVEDEDYARVLARRAVGGGGAAAMADNLPDEEELDDDADEE